MERKIERREREGRGFHRLAKSTLAQGNRKKLTEKVRKDAWSKEVDVRAVMFVPLTIGGKLAKSLIEAEEKLGSLTGYRVKMVQKVGDKLEDLLTKSNPWQGLDCGRQGCLLCTTN